MDFCSDFIPLFANPIHGTSFFYELRDFRFFQFWEVSKIENIEKIGPSMGFWPPLTHPLLSIDANNIENFEIFDGLLSILKSLQNRKYWKYRKYRPFYSPMTPFPSQKGLKLEHIWAWTPTLPHAIAFPRGVIYLITGPGYCMGTSCNRKYRKYRNA